MLSLECLSTDNYPMFTTKKEDYLKWKSLVYCKKNKEHLTFNGLEAMKTIKTSMNNG